jgi:hypothetical protein
VCNHRIFPFYCYAVHSIIIYISSLAFREEADSGVSPFSLRNIPAIFCDEKTQTTPITENQIDTSVKLGFS